MGATSTANTILKSSATSDGVFAKLVDIISYPDLGSEPNKLDTTTLSATKFKTNILGLQEAPDLSFEALYDEDAYTTISTMNGTHFFELHFGDDGADGIFAWSGGITVFITGGGVDEVRKMTIVVSAETEISKKA